MRYRSNVIWTLFGKSTFLGCQFLLIIFLSKFASLADLGSYSLGLAVAAPIFLLCNLGLRILLATEADIRDKFSSYVLLRIVLSLLAIPVVILACRIMDLDTDVTFVVTLVAMIKFFDSISDIFYGGMQGMARMDLIAKSQIIRGGISVIVFAILFWLTDSIHAALIGIVVSWFIVVILFDYNYVVRLGIERFRLFELLPEVIVSDEQAGGKKYRLNQQLSSLLAKGIPLGMVIMMGSFTANIPSYLIEHKMSLEDVGVFASLIYLIQSTSTFMSALWEPAVPRLTQYREKCDHISFIKLVVQLSVLGGLIGFVGTLIIYWQGELILNVLFNEHFAKNVDVLLILSLVLIVRYIGGVWSVSTSVLKLYWVQVPINVINMLFVLIGCYFLLDDYGLKGAAYALLISTFVTRFLFLIVMSKGIIALKKSKKEIHPQTC